MTISELIAKWLTVLAADTRTGETTAEPAAPVKPIWRELLRATVQTRGLGRILVTKGIATQAEIDAAITLEVENLDEALTSRFGPPA